MKLKSIRIILLFCISFGISSVMAQITEKGEPLFFKDTSKQSLPIVDLPDFNLIYNQIIQQEKTQSRTKGMRYAYEYAVNYNLKNSGTWQSLTDGRKVWRLSIRSKGAYSLGLYFNRYHLPKDAKLFIYNKKNKRYLGAFTAKNNKKWGGLAIQAFAGEQLTIEYIEPKNPDFKGTIELGKVLHDYKNISNYIKNPVPNGLGHSGDCNVDINCSAGKKWQLEKRAVCKIISGGYYGSGVLLNNSDFDEKPYFLTAYHVVSTADQAHNTIFYFNYENTKCNSNDAQENETISGAELRAKSPLKNTKEGIIPHLDFSLLEISTSIPMSYKPYYAGWDCSGKIPTSTVSIHHPQGDAKKISVDNHPPKTATYSDDVYHFDKNSHWQILEWDLGTTEGGSSGAPLFDNNHRVIGDLTGGDATCDSPKNDFYAKLSVSWDKYPKKENQLKYWLNPAQINSKTLNGLDPCANVYADFIVPEEMVCVNAATKIINYSSGNLDYFEWDFGEDAEPKTFKGENPPKVRYQTTGIKIITLTVLKGEQEYKVSKQLHVVKQPKADFDYVLQGDQTIGFMERCIDATSYFWFLGDNNTSEQATFNHRYDDISTYRVTLIATNNCGEENVSKLVSLSFDKSVKIYPNPSDGQFTVDLHQIKNEKILWEIYTTDGRKIKEGQVSEAEKIVLNLQYVKAGVYLLKLNIDNHSIVNRKLIKIN